MVSDTGQYSLLRIAVENGDLPRVRELATQVPVVRLDDALRICLLVRDRERTRYDAAAARWLARLAMEVPGITVADLRRAAAALEQLPAEPEDAMATLSALCVRLGVAR